MKQKLRLSAIHQIATSLQRTHNLNPRTIWYPALDESNWMKSAYFTIHLGKNPPPQNGCRLKSAFFFKSTNFHSSTFPIQPDFSQNQPAAITMNTGCPWTSPMIALERLEIFFCHGLQEMPDLSQCRLLRCCWFCFCESMSLTTDEIMKLEAMCLGLKLDLHFQQAIKEGQFIGLLILVVAGLKWAWLCTIGWNTNVQKCEFESAK